MSGKIYQANNVSLGWRDIIGEVRAPTSGPSVPVWTQMGSSVFYAYKFGINDYLWFFYHMPHDYAPGTPLYPHVHWLPDGTNTNTVKWEFTYSFAKGFNQEAFNLTGTTTTAETAGPGTAWTHMVSEVEDIDSIDGGIEVDGILMTRIQRISNGGTDNTDDIFVIMADLHYQADRLTTPKKRPGFY